MKTHNLRTCEFGFHDITAQVELDVRESGIREGLCTVFCTHTTAAITINENAKAEMNRDASAYQASIPANAKEVPEDDKTIGRLIREGSKPPRDGDRDSVTSPTSPRSGKGSDERPSSLPPRQGTSQSTVPSTAPTTESNTEEPETAASTKQPAETETESNPSSSEETVSKPATPAPPAAPTTPSRPSPSSVPPRLGSSGKQN